MASGGKDLEETTVQPKATQHPKVAKGNFPTGYECEFVEPPPKILTTECSVCLHIPREPHQVSCCRHHFCKSCIERARSENKPCPLCNQLDFTATLDKNVQRHLNALKVYCTNRRKGCEWVGELRHLDHHLNANPTSAEELTGCEFVELSCIYGCGGRFQRCSLNDHCNTCFSCEYCGHSSTYHDVVTNHWPECPKYPLQCPNSCENSPIERQNLEDHINKECPLQKVNCEFQYAGCTAQVQRRDMAAHVRDNLPQHISQLSSTTRILAADIRDEIKQKFEQETTILKDQMEQRQQRVEGMVKQEQAEAKAQQQSLERKIQELKQMMKTASDNTQRQTQTGLKYTKTSLSQYGMIVAAIILALVAVFAAVIIMQHQQIQQQQQEHTEATELIRQLRQDHIEATEQLREDHIEATEQLREDHIEATEQLRQGHIEATKQIQQQQEDHTEATEQLRQDLIETTEQLRQGHIKATEQLRQQQQDHIEATEQIQQLRQDHIEATELIRQLRQDHIEATEELRQGHIDATEQLHQGHIEATEQIEQLKQGHIEATEQIEQLKQDHIEATKQITQLRQGHIEATEQLHQGHIEATEQIEQLKQGHIEATEQIEQLKQGHIEATKQITQLRQGHIEATEELRRGHIEATEQLRQDHIKATEQLRQGHIEATEQLRQGHIEATEQLRRGHIEATEQLRQDHIKATEQLRQDHSEATEQLRQDHNKATERLQHDRIEATERLQQLRQDHIEATEQLRQDHIEATELLHQIRQNHSESTERLSDGLQNLQYQLHHAPEYVSPSMCTADGPGLHSPTVNVKTEVTVSVVSILGLAYSGKGISVTAELESDGTLTQANVSCIAASKYRVTFTPRVRGWSKLYVKVNNSDIKGSPFGILVSPEHPQEIGGYNQPWGIAINSHWEIYVTEWWGDKVSVFGYNQENRTIESTGTGDGKFVHPAGIDIDADDNVYVASEYKLQKFNRNGEHVKSVGSNEIRGVKVHDEKVYVCDRDNNGILVYNLELTLIRQFATAGTGEGEFDRPYDIAVDAKGNIYVVDFGNKRIQVLNENGWFLREFGRGKLKYPCGIHIDGDYVYVADWSGDHIIVFRTSGEFITTLGKKLGRVYGITTDSNGSLYVCDHSKHHCEVL